MPQVLRNLTSEDLSNLLEGLPPEKILKAFPVEERIRELPPEKIFKAYPAEERLRGLSEEDIAAYLKILMRKQQKNSG